MTTDTHPSPITIWIMAVRPKTLWAGICPVLIGIAMAAKMGSLHLYSAIICLLVAIGIQVGTNFANDYYDFMKGADTKDRCGPTRVTQAGLVSPRTMKYAYCVTMGCVVILGLSLYPRAGWPVIIMMVSSIASGILYTAGPFPLGYNGLGEIFVIIFFGPVAVGGTYFMQQLHLTGEVLLASIAPGFLSAAILAVNNLRDFYEDCSTGKKTLAVRFGLRFAKLEYAFFVLSSAIIPIILWLTTENNRWVLLGSLTVVPSVIFIRFAFRHSDDGEKLNHLLSATGNLLALYSILFSVGWLI